MVEMKDPKKLFHQISYLQYPLMLLGLFYCYRPLLNQLNNLWVDINLALVFMGLGISFSTLQDTTKTQNKISKRIFQNEKYARRFLVILFLQVLFFTTFGIVALFQPENSPIKNVSLGIISIGIGLIGVLKSAGEMAVNHRKPVEISEPSHKN